MSLIRRTLLLICFAILLSAGSSMEESNRNLGLGMPGESIICGEKFYSWIEICYNIRTKVIVETNLGGWSKADITSDNVKDAAKFAVNSEYTESDVNYEIVEALQQVVAGMNYNLTLKITDNSSSACSLHRYKVYRKFDQTYLLTLSTDLGECS